MSDDELNIPMLKENAMSALPHSNDSVRDVDASTQLEDDAPTAHGVAERETDPQLRTLELREEQLVALKEVHEVGEIRLRTEVEHVPSRLEVDTVLEEIVVEHEPVSQVVRERVQPWQEDGVLILPVYEEQLVVVKRLVLKERLRIRRVAATERHVFEETLRRERLVIEDPDQSGVVHEQYPLVEQTHEDTGPLPDAGADAANKPEGGLLEDLVRKALS